MSTRIHTIRIVGDRQTGKTEAALSYASTLIASGVGVAYYTEQPTMLRVLLERYAHNHLRPGQVLYRGNGNERVRDESGGMLYFTTPRRGHSSYRGSLVQTVILDDVAGSWDDATIQYRHPHVTHVVRTVL